MISTKDKALQSLLREYYKKFKVSLSIRDNAKMVEIGIDALKNLILPLKNYIQLHHIVRSDDSLIFSNFTRFNFQYVHSQIPSLLAFPCFSAKHACIYI